MPVFDKIFFSSLTWHEFGNYFIDYLNCSIPVGITIYCVCVFFTEKPHFGTIDRSTNIHGQENDQRAKFFWAW